MRVEVERSGGFAGLTSRRAVDARELPAELERHARALLEDPAPAAPSETKPPGGADRFQYRVRVSDEGREAERVGNEGQLRPELSALAAWVMRHGQPPGE
jgi:hypothetical protein